jgi:phage tail-like protein
MAQDTPVAASRFGISIDGVQIASFSELQGITTEVDVIEHIESTNEGVRVMKIPGVTRPKGEVKFKMAMGTNLEMNSWLEAAQSGMMDQARKSCSLVMYDAENKPVARFYLENAWPTKCVLNPLRAGGNDVMQQEWSLTFEGIQRVL